MDARDIAAVGAVALTEDGHVGKTYTITGPAAVTHAELGNAIRRPVRFESIPSEAFIAAVTGAGMPRWKAEGLAEDYAHYDRGEASAVSPDVAQVTGTSARSLSDFAHEYAPRLQSAQVVRYQALTRLRASGHPTFDRHTTGDGWMITSGPSARCRGLTH